MEPWRAVDAHNGGVKAQNGAVEGRGRSQWRRDGIGGSEPVITDSHHFDEDPKPHQSENSDPDPN
jgi:hypothetical protein